MRHRPFGKPPRMKDGPPRPNRLNSGDLAETPAGSFVNTPIGKITSMRTPVSRDVSGESADMLSGHLRNTPTTIRRRASSELSWLEDTLQEIAQVRRRIPTTPLAAAASGDGDASAGPSQPQVSLSESGLGPRLCCMIPGLCLFGCILAQLVIAVISTESFLATTGVLTVYVFTWTTNMAIFSAVGAWRMRRDALKDWHRMAEEAREAGASSLRGKGEVMHIVILPNYKEDEDMLEETLTNIALSPAARGSIRVVLGMEEREVGAAEKAERLISRTKHLFADIVAAFHPPGRLGELAGKSSNSQWAYREALRQYADQISKRDPSRVIISVGDADTMWNPQYFDALTYEAHTKSAEELAWTIWQPPMLLFRNLFAVPGVTRLSGFGTLLFEVSGLANQGLCPHFCFSSYSLTLALANHHKVRGWDTDVIAEDHHMFVKCFFAALWEQVEHQCEGKPHNDKATSSYAPAVGKVRLQPIYLPAEGYLVESSQGYWQSVWARFQQARRHSQGVSELSYAILQYWRIMHYCKGRARLSWRAHREVWAIFWKMSMIHIINNVQAVSLLIAGMLMVLGILTTLWTGGLFACIAALMEHGVAGVGATGMSAYGLAKWGLFLTFGPAPPVGFISAAAIFVVVHDVIEGRYCRLPSQSTGDGDKDAVSGSGREEKTNLSRWESLMLALRMQCDMLFLAEPTILLYGMLPAMMAAWSLMWRGTEFEYIVAAKPGDK